MTAKDTIHEIALIIYGREDYKTFLARDLGIARPTLDRYLLEDDLKPALALQLKGLAMVKAQDKEREAADLRDIITRF